MNFSFCYKCLSAEASTYPLTKYVESLFDQVLPHMFTWYNEKIKNGMNAFWSEKKKKISNAAVNKR